ncbi:Adenine phosphoribosyltransferase [compost metagenome]
MQIAGDERLQESLEELIRDVPDYPKPGIVFKDITPLLKDATAFERVVTAIADHYRNQRIDYVVGIESRGFIFGAAVATALKAGFIPVRKPGKLPHLTHRCEYALEYGTDALEIHQDAVEAGKRVLIVDDVLATGGTAAAAVELVTCTGGQVAGLAFLIELGFLNGREKVPGLDVLSLVTY